MTQTLQFISWSRRGAGAVFTAEADGVRRSVSLPLRVNVAGRQVDASSAPIRLSGTGRHRTAGRRLRHRPPQSTVRRPTGGAEVVGLHRIRSSRCALAVHPEAAAPDGKVTPWVMLVVVEMSRQRERDALRQCKTTPYQVLGVNGEELPDPNNAWAFAHVQAVAATAADGAAATKG